MSSTMRAICGVLLISVGCGDDALARLDGGATLDAGLLDAGLVDASAVEAAAVQCGDLSASACTPGLCVRVTARRIDEATRCFAEAAEVGCTSRDQLCTQASTLARQRDGGLWQFADGCLPEGWTESPIRENGISYGSESPASWAAFCQAADAGSGKPCAERSASECSADSCRPLFGRHIDPAMACALPTGESVGCMDLHTGCNTSITLASDPDGGIWQFTSGCIPRGWMTNPNAADGGPLSFGYVEPCH